MGRDGSRGGREVARLERSTRGRGMMLGREKKEAKYDPLKDRSSVNYVQPDEIVEPLTDDGNGNVTMHDPMPSREAPNNRKVNDG
jgi:hypothetical protein